MTSLDLKLRDGSDFVFHCSFLDTHTSPWHTVRAQKVIADEERTPGGELTNLKKKEKAERSLLLLWTGKFCLRQQEKKPKSKKDKNESG